MVESRHLVPVLSYRLRVLSLILQCWESNCKCSPISYIFSPLLMTWDFPVAQVGLNPKLFLFQPLLCWDYMCVPLHLALDGF